MIKTSEQAIKISKSVFSFCKTVLDKRYSNKSELLKGFGEYNATNNPQLLKQSLAKSSFHKLTLSKKEALEILKETDETFSTKVYLANSKEIADLKFFSEANTSSRFANTSESLEEIILNDEQRASTTITGVRTFDVTAVVQGKFLNLDIKAGNNMSATFNHVLAEIPYVENGVVYDAILNGKISLDKVQKDRVNFLQQKKESLATILKNINEENLDDITKNLKVQEQLLSYIAENPNNNFNPSFFYGIFVDKDLCQAALPKDNLLANVILKNPNFLNNKKEFNNVIKFAISLYNQETGSIISNIQNSQIAWVGSEIDQIQNDIF